MSPAGNARFCLVLAAIMWSSGSLFMRLLREPTGMGWNDPLLTPIQITFFRGLFGGLALLTLVRRGDLYFRPMMAVMVLTFTLMSVLYLSALGLGPAANAILLQNTAPIWVYLFTVLVLGESADRRGWQSVILGGLGAVVIVAGNWPRDLPPDEQRSQVLILLMGVACGIVYAAVVLFLRHLKHYSSAWLIVLNLVGTAVTLAIFVLISEGPAAFWHWVTQPTPEQLVIFVLYGVLQMAIPYWLFARGLRSVSPQEAGIITLIEPLLNPLWAYLITPEKDAPTVPMLIGGGFILTALVWRYVAPSRPIVSAKMSTSDR